MGELRDVKLRKELEQFWKEFYKAYLKAESIIQSEVKSIKKRSSKKDFSSILNPIEREKKKKVYSEAMLISTKGLEFRWLIPSILGIDYLDKKNRSKLKRYYKNLSKLEERGYIKIIKDKNNSHGWTKDFILDIKLLKKCDK